MSVLIEGISVIFKLNSILHHYQGGWEKFVKTIPNASLCADGELVRVGFMFPADVRDFVESIEAGGLIYKADGVARDLAVVDQRTGPVLACDWLRFGVSFWNEALKQRVAICTAADGSEHRIAVPSGWKYEGSLSEDYRFVESGALPDNLKLVRSEDGVDVYMDIDSGKEYYVGRTV